MANDYLSRTKARLKEKGIIVSNLTTTNKTGSLARVNTTLVENAITFLFTSAAIIGLSIKINDVWAYVVGGVSLIKTFTQCRAEMKDLKEQKKLIKAQK